MNSIFYITIRCIDFYMIHIIDIYILVCCFRIFVLFGVLVFCIDCIIGFYFG